MDTILSNAGFFINIGEKNMDTILPRLWNHEVALEDEYFKTYGKFSYIKLNESEDEAEILRMNEREEYLQDLASLESERFETASELEDEYNALEEDEEAEEEEVEVKITEMEEA